MRTVGPEQAELVASWATSEQEARWWAGAPYPVPPSLVSSWADDPDAHGFVLYHGTEPIAYGEIWDDADEGESELAHLIVAPDCRGQGFGRRLVRSLVPRAGFGALVMRVHPDNSAAQACYLGAGFGRVDEAREAEWNAPQPVRYVWLEYTAF
nr:GNAT family N-acetyltransferase [Kineosporia rhizophila]